MLLLFTKDYVGFVFSLTLILDIKMDYSANTTGSTMLHNDMLLSRIKQEPVDDCSGNIIGNCDKVDCTKLRHCFVGNIKVESTSNIKGEITECPTQERNTPGIVKVNCISEAEFYKQTKCDPDIDYKIPDETLSKTSNIDGISVVNKESTDFFSVSHKILEGNSCNDSNMIDNSLKNGSIVFSRHEYYNDTINGSTVKCEINDYKETGNNLDLNTDSSNLEISAVNSITVKDFNSTKGCKKKPNSTLTKCTSKGSKKNPTKSKKSKGKRKLKDFTKKKSTLQIKITGKVKHRLYDNLNKEFKKEENITSFDSSLTMVHNCDDTKPKSNLSSNNVLIKESLSSNNKTASIDNESTEADTATTSGKTKVDSNSKDHGNLEKCKFNIDTDDVRKKTEKYKNPLICKECGKCLPGKGYYDRHMLTHSPDHIYVCQWCGKKFNKQSILKKHSRVHNGEKPYACTQCGLKFPHNGSLWRHKKTVHAGEKPYKCDQCGKCFGRLSYLECHLASHNGVRPYVCTICDKGFLDKPGLIRHTRTHTGEKPHQCEECEKRFTTKKALRDHMNIHRNVRPYVCTVCSKAFRNTQGLQRHFKGHFPTVRTHFCEVCDKGFTRAYSLKRHLDGHKNKTLGRRRRKKKLEDDITEEDDDI